MCLYQTNTKPLSQAKLNDNAANKCKHAIIYMNVYLFVILKYIFKQMMGYMIKRFYLIRLTTFFFIIIVCNILFTQSFQGQ